MNVCTYTYTEPPADQSFKTAVCTYAGQKN